MNNTDGQSLNRPRKVYKTDLTDDQWALLQPLIPPAKPGGRDRKVNIREIINTLFYQQRTGVQWDLLPHDLSPKSTAYDYYRAWIEDGTWQVMVDTLRGQVRVAAGREETPSVANIDSQSVDTTPVGGPERGRDNAKNVDGRKRNIVVDSLGLLMVVAVTAASVDDAKPARGLFTQLDSQKYPRLETVYADSKYHNHSLKAWMSEQGCQFKVEVVSRPPGTKGWIKLPKRWVVERSIAWINRDRRNSKDYERDPKSSEARMQLSAIGTMLRRLTHNQLAKGYSFNYRPDTPEISPG
jgi:putative transposase